jgi:UDP-glucose 4-epimerase
LTIFGDGEQSRSFTYIDDVAPYIADSVNISNAYNRAFNIGGHEVHSVRKLASAVCDAMGVKLKVQELGKRDEVVHAYADHARFKTVFNPGETTNLEKGLSKMAAWVKTLDPRPCSGREFGSIEIKKNLPDSWK